VSIRTLVVDDEPLAREKLRTFLESEDDLEVIGEAGDGREAILTIERERPDLVFLDVQMPELDGFQVLAHLDAEAVPRVIFVTAFDQYAIKAFEVHALDYLLKPFDRERLRESVARARSEIQDGEGGPKGSEMREQLVDLLRDLEKERPKHPERLVIKNSGRIVFLPVAEIDWIDAAGNYVRINTGGESHMLRETMSRLEERLDPDLFLRIHRSTIVNVGRIKEMQQQFHGDYVVVLTGGQRLTLSRSYRERLQELLDREL